MHFAENVKFYDVGYLSKFAFFVAGNSFLKKKRQLVESYRSTLQNVPIILALTLGCSSDAHLNSRIQYPNSEAALKIRLGIRNFTSDFTRLGTSRAALSKSVPLATVAPIDDNICDYEPTGLWITGVHLAF